MDSRNKICKIFAIIVLNLYLQLATATNIDCNGKSFHCVNSTHFMICVDFGGGVSITVNDFVIQCPPTTVCGENNHLECTYQIPTTTQTNTHPGDETSDFTTETRIITTTSSDMTNTISTIDKTSMAGLFDEHFNTIEVTTFANHAPDVQTYRNKVSGITEILKSNRPLSDDHSNILQATTDLYSAENPPAKSPENHSPNEQMISITATPVTDIGSKTFFSDAPDLNGESSSVKLMDALHDAPTKTLAQNASIVIDRETDTDVVNQLKQNDNHDKGIKPLPEIIITTETTFFTQYPRVQENHNLDNTSTTVKNTIKQGIEEKNYEVDNITSVKLKQINGLTTKEENGPKNSFLTSTENSNFKSTRIGSEIEFTNEADLLGPKTENTILIKDLYPFELNASDITESYQVTNIPSTLQPTITPSRAVSEAVLVTTETGISYIDQEMLISSKRGTTSTLHSPTILENDVSKSTTNKINMTSLDFKSISEDTTLTQMGNVLGNEMPKIEMETIFPSPPLNTSSPDDGQEDGKETSNITTDHLYSDHHTSTIDYRSTIAELNLLKQTFQDDKFKESTLYDQHIPQVILQEDNSTTHVNIPDLSVNEFNSVNDDLTSLLPTLDSTINSMENMTGKNEAIETTEVYNNGNSQKSSQVSTEVSSSTIYPILFNYNASYFENTTATGMNTTSVRDKYNSSYENLMKTPQLNINDQYIEVMVTQTSHNTTEYNKLRQEEIILQVTEKPYSDDPTLSTENKLPKSELYLNKQLEDNKTYTSSPREQYKSEEFLFENITTNPESHDFPVHTASSLLDYDITTTSLSSTFEQETPIEQLINRKEAIERSTIPYYNTVPYTNLSDNENETENSTQVTLNSIQSEYRISDVQKLEKNETTSIRHYENLTYKPAIQNPMQKLSYDTQIEKTKPLYNSGVTKDLIYSESQMEMNTTITLDNHNSSYETMKTTSQYNINSQGIEITITEASCNTTECNKLISQENVQQITENPTSLSVENIVESELYLGDQQLGDSISYTSTQQGQYKSELFVSENISKTNRKNLDFSVSTESSLPNYDYTTPSLISTVDQVSEIEQVTGEKKETEGTTIPYRNTEPYTNLIENEHPTEKSPLNSTQFEYRISDIQETMDTTTPMHHYENSKYKPDVQNIMQKILYDTQLENTKHLNATGTVKDSTVTTPGMYHVVSNVKLSESTMIKSELTPMATSNSISELEILQNDLKDELNPLSYSDLISSATPQSQAGQNMLISWRDVISPSAENSTTSKNNIVDLNRVPVNSVDHSNVNFTGIITNMTNSINITSIVLDKLEHKKPDEMVLLTGIEKITRDNKSSDTINEIHNIGQTSSSPEIYGDTHTNEVTIQNQEAYNGSMKLTIQNRNIETTETSLWEGYNLTHTEILLLNENVTSPTSKSLITTSVTGVDKILSLPNQITPELVTKSYLATDNPKDINTTNKIFKNTFTYIQDNNESEIHVDATQIENSVQKLAGQSKNDQTNQYFIETIRSNNDTDTNTTNIILFNKPYEHYFSPNLSSHNLETFKGNEEAKIDVPLRKSLKSNKIPPGIVENSNYTYSVTPKAKFINITNNVTNEQSTLDSYSTVESSVNFPLQFHNNDGSAKRDSINDIIMTEIVTSIPKLDVYSNLSHVALNNRTVNDNHMNTKEFNTTNEDQISNKRSMFINSKILTDNPTFITDKSYANDEDRITAEKSPPNTQLFFDFPSTTTGEIKSKNIDANKSNYTLNEHNSTGVASNTTEHSQLLHIPIQYLASATTVPFRPLVSLNNSEQPSLAPKLKETNQKDDLNINNTNGNNYKVAVIDQTKKDERITMKPRATINIKKRLLAPPLVKIKILNNTNVGMKPFKRSTNSALFKCNYQSRGRFADKNNCRKYYICIGLREPILGECPRSTVFSEIRKQCTKNLSHCIRNNQFRCTQEGRFSDVLRSNIYYICVHYNNTFVRFQFQCQNGFHLNKTSVRCVKDIIYQSVSQITSLSADSLSNKGSDQSTVESQIKERKLSQEDAKYTCKKEGKFHDEEDCRRYYVCTKNSKSVFRRRTKKCDSDEVFHREKKKCVDNDSYECY